MQNEETYFKKIEREWDSFWSFAKRRPFLCTVSVIIIGTIIFLNIYDRSKLKTKIANLKETITTKNVEIQKLNTELTPFRTVALQWYPGSETEALKKLAQRMTGIEEKVQREREYRGKKRVYPAFFGGDISYIGDSTISLPRFIYLGYKPEWVYIIPKTEIEDMGFADLFTSIVEDGFLINSEKLNKDGVVYTVYISKSTDEGKK